MCEISNKLPAHCTHIECVRSAINYQPTVLTLSVVAMTPSSPYCMCVSMRSWMRWISAPRWRIWARTTTNWNMGNRSSRHHTCSSCRDSWTVWKNKAREREIIAIGRKEMFYLRLYGVRHMVMDHSDRDSWTVWKNKERKRQRDNCYRAIPWVVMPRCTSQALFRAHMDNLGKEGRKCFI